MTSISVSYALNFHFITDKLLKYVRNVTVFISSTEQVEYCTRDMMLQALSCEHQGAFETITTDFIDFINLFQHITSLRKSFAKFFFFC